MKTVMRSARHLEVQHVGDGETVSVYLTNGARLVIEHSESSGDSIVVIQRGDRPVTAYDANGDELANLSYSREREVVT